MRDLYGLAVAVAVMSMATGVIRGVPPAVAVVSGLVGLGGSVAIVWGAGRFPQVRQAAIGLADEMLHRPALVVVGFLILEFGLLALMVAVDAI